MANQPGVCAACEGPTSGQQQIRCWSCHVAARRKYSHCLVAECGTRASGAGLCSRHRMRWRDGLMPHPDGRPLTGELCAIDGCDRPGSRARGWCSMHWQRWRKHGDPEMRVRDGSGWLNEDGYRVVYRGGRQVLEHRWVYQQVLSRPLLDTEEVHHRNGQRSDNRIENLELWSKSQPAGQRVTDKVAWALELLALYAPETLADRPVQLRLIG